MNPTFRPITRFARLQLTVASWRDSRSMEFARATWLNAAPSVNAPAVSPVLPVPMVVARFIGDAR